MPGTPAKEPSRPLGPLGDKGYHAVCIASRISADERAAMAANIVHGANRSALAAQDDEGVGITSKVK